MNIFNIFKKKGVCWRDSNGNIICPGDSCPQECDRNCPIWCHTLAVNSMQMGRLDDAIAYFKESLSIAPDYKESWVNMASIYGQKSNHLEANKSFLMAYQLDNHYANAIRGVIASYKNMGHFNEALQFCEIFKSNIGNTVEEKELRESVLKAQSSGRIKRTESDVDIAQKAIEQASKLGIMPANDKMPIIPELFVIKNRACLELRQALLESGKSDIYSLDPIVWFLWPIYAGIGAVYHWHINWAELQQKGVIPTLLETCGVDTMDEYVLDAIGVGYGSEKGNKLYSQFQMITLLLSKDNIDIDRSFHNSPKTLEFMQAMFVFGMAYEMNRLGMR